MINGFVKTITISSTVAVLALGATLTMAQAQPTAPEAAKSPAYVGSKACKVCHMGEKKGKMWEIWSESKHATAMASLDTTKGEHKDPKCLKCHATGYGAGGYGAEGMAEKDLAAVGCEACHGAGSEYKTLKIMKDHAAAVAAGLKEAGEAACKKCHNEESPTFKGFKFEEHWAKIAHKVPPAAAGEAKPQGQ